VSDKADILIFGTGNFAGRIALDLAATASEPVTVAIAGRNRDRLDWLRTAGNARAALFGRPARFTSHEVDLSVPDAAATALAATEPKVVVQAASFQTGNVISNQDNAWTSSLPKAA
jgi:saccharopine dehydrogenase-like NADP-dependent oxidoreductase